MQPYTFTKRSDDTKLSNLISQDLNELYYKLFHSNFENAHNAFSDILATIKCFKELRKKGIIEIPDDNSDLPF